MDDVNVSWKKRSATKVFLFLFTQVFLSHAQSQRICTIFCRKGKIKFKMPFKLVCPIKSCLAIVSRFKHMFTLPKNTNESTGFKC